MLFNPLSEAVMSNMIRTIIRKSILLSEKFSPQLKKRAQLTASHKAGLMGRKHPEGIIYSQQGQEFNTSPMTPLKEYQKNQPSKKRHSWIPAIDKKAGMLYRKYSDGKIHLITKSGAQICAPDNFKL